MLDTKALAAATAVIVREHVDAATAPLLARIALLEEAKADTGPMLCEIVASPDFAARVKDVTESVVLGLPAPKDGKDVDPEAIAALVEEAVARAVRALPPAERGEKGDAGDPGVPGVPGKDGADGRDGCGVKDLLIDREGALVATMDDGRTKNLGVIVGKDGLNGAPGADGRDGFGLEQFDTKWDGDRTLKLIFSDGQSEYSHEIRLPIILDRGVYSEGKDYETGDAVTWGGSMWVAQRNTSAKPDSADSGWRLAVKRGRDGKDKA